MADKEPEILFEIDAAKILAKLHLAGVMAIKEGGQDETFLVNTGIKNDDHKKKPEDPGKVEFDLGNTQGEFEVGYVTNLEYSRTQQTLKNLLSKRAQYTATNDNAPLVDKDGKKELPKNEHQKEIDEIDQKLEEIGLKKDLLDDPEKLQAEVDKIEKSGVAEEAKQYETKLAEKKKEAFEAIQKYFTIFAGADMANKLTEDSMVMINLSDKIKDEKDKNLAKAYEIAPISDKDKEAMIAQFDADPEECVERICFKVGYKLELEK